MTADILHVSSQFYSNAGFIDTFCLDVFQDHTVWTTADFYPEVEKGWDFSCKVTEYSSDELGDGCV